MLKLARAMAMLMMGTVALDGTKIHANASRHSALSYGHARKIEALPKELGRTRRILADSGYLCQANAERCEAAQIEPKSPGVPSGPRLQHHAHRRLAYPPQAGKAALFH